MRYILYTMLIWVVPTHTSYYDYSFVLKKDDVALSWALSNALGCFYDRYTTGLDHPEDEKSSYGCDIAYSYPVMGQPDVPGSFHFVVDPATVTDRNDQVFHGIVVKIIDPQWSMDAIAGCLVFTKPDGAHFAQVRGFDHMHDWWHVPSDYKKTPLLRALKDAVIELLEVREYRNVV